MFDSTVASTPSNSSTALLEKPNMMFLSREATEKDHSLKAKILISSDMAEKKKNGELIWLKNEYFSDQRADCSMSKKNFLENSLIYLNQGTISSIKNELAVYVVPFWVRLYKL